MTGADDSATLLAELIRDAAAFAQALTDADPRARDRVLLAAIEGGSVEVVLDLMRQTAELIAVSPVGEGETVAELRVASRGHR